jgi:hypothetical protein
MLRGLSARRRARIAGVAGILQVLPASGEGSSTRDLLRVLTLTKPQCLAELICRLVERALGLFKGLNPLVYEALSY